MSDHKSKHQKQEINRPDPEDIIYGELNVERWPALWNTSDTKEPRSLERETTFPNGSRLKARLTIVPSATAGDLTTETLKIFSVLLAMRRDSLRLKGKTPSDSPASERIPLTLRSVAKRLHPGSTKTDRWGGKQHASIKRHLRKLVGVSISFDGSFWDAAAEKRRRYEGGFSLVSDYLIAEERRFGKGETVQLPLDLGYFRLNQFLIDNLARGFHAPFYLSQRLRIRSPFALLLYNHLDLKMSNLERYERDIEGLFVEDFPHVGVRYPAPSQRLRLLERTLKELTGLTMTSGVIKCLDVCVSRNRRRRKLVVTKAPFVLRLVDREDPLRDKFVDREPSEAELRRECVVDDVIEVTRDVHSRDFYRLVAHHLPQDVVYRFLSEIRADEAGEFRGSKGMLFTVKVKFWCKEQGLDPFWKSDSAAS